MNMDQILASVKLFYPGVEKYLNRRKIGGDNDENYIKLINFFEQRNSDLSKLLVHEFTQQQLKKMTGFNVPEARIAAILRFKEENKLTWPETSRQLMYLTWDEHNIPTTVLTILDRRMNSFAIGLWIVLMLMCLGGLVFLYQLRPIQSMAVLIVYILLLLLDVSLMICCLYIQKHLIAPHYKARFIRKRQEQRQDSPSI